MRTVCLIGCGEMLVGPQVIAGVIQRSADMDLEVRLCDPNEERLDLMDRLARDIADVILGEPKILASSNLDDSLFEADFAIWSLYEEAVRRMVVPLQIPRPIVGESDHAELRRGDLNRPTPVDKMSARVREVLSVPLGEADLAQAIMSLKESASHVSRHCTVEGCLAVPDAEVTLPRPDSICAEEWQIPHQVLRWIGKDESLAPLLQAGKAILFPF